MFFAIIQKQIPEARLIIAGDGPQRDALERLATDLRLTNTEFVGRLPHERVIELYECTDIFLNGSFIDNQPLSILEAFACGLPVVTTDAGGIPFMVNSEQSGLIVPMGNPERLAGCALRLFSDEELSGRLIANGRRECSKYEWEAVRDQWLAIYARLATTTDLKRAQFREESDRSETCV